MAFRGVLVPDVSDFASIELRGKVYTDDSWVFWPRHKYSIAVICAHACSVFYLVHNLFGSACSLYA
jgi:hypothetical protein